MTCFVGRGSSHRRSRHHIWEQKLHAPIAAAAAAAAKNTNFVVGAIREMLQWSVFFFSLGMDAAVPDVLWSRVFT